MQTSMLKAKFVLSSLYSCKGVGGERGGGALVSSSAVSTVTEGREFSTCIQYAVSWGFFFPPVSSRSLV